MKAWTLYDVGDFAYGEVAEPEAPDGWTLVRMTAAGVCGSDIPRIYETGAHRHPLIPGHEFAGVEVESGRRVGVFPLIPCGKCSCCQKKQYEMCENYNYLGSRCDGGFAELVAVPEWNLLELPDSVSDEQAAMLEPLAVAIHGVRAMDVKQGEKVLVCGLGTIGMFYAMVLQAYGADVYVVGKREAQRKRALEVGIPADHYFDYGAEEKPRDMDVFFECVGIEESLAYGLDTLAAGGRMLLVGNPHGDMNLARNDYWKILRKQLRVQGTWNSSYTGEVDDDWHESLRLIGSGEVQPEKLITNRYPLEELDQGLAVMRDKSVDSCKVMVGNK